MQASIDHAARLMRADGVLYAFIAAYTLAGLLALHLSGAGDRAAYSIYYWNWAVLFLNFFPAIAVLADTGLVLHRFDTRRRLAFRRVFTPLRIAQYLAGSALLMAMVFFQGTFTSLKNVLVVWQGGFPHDRLHADIDRMIHFGIDPWRLVEPLVANAWLRPVVEFSYDIAWFVICFTALYLAVVSPRAVALRGRYIATFMLVWIVVGNVLAGLFLSAGPAFYGQVTGDHGRFGELVAHLAEGRDGAFSAAAFQAYLWKVHALGASGFGSGISAFPSVHVGLIAMNTLFAFEIDRRLGYALAAYTVFIVASSVALGWHYAIDGYVAVVVVIALHALLKRLADRRAAPRQAAVGGLDPVTAS